MNTVQSISIPVQDMGLDLRTVKHDEKAAQNWRVRVLHASWALLKKDFSQKLALFVLDTFACIAGMFCGWLIGTQVIEIDEPFQKYFISIVVMCFCMVGSFYALKGYKPIYLRRQEKELEIIVKSTTFSLLVIFAFNFLVFKTAGFSRYVYVFDYVFILAFLMAIHFGIKRLYRKLWANNIGRERSLVVGQDPKCISWLRDQFRIQQFSRFELIGYMEQVNDNLYYVVREKKTPVKGDLVRFLNKIRVSTIFFALNAGSSENHKVFLDLLSASEKNDVQVFTLSEAVMRNNFSYDMDQYVGLAGMRRIEPELEKHLPQFIKRVVDIIGAVVGLISLSPLLILIAIAVKIQDGGKVFHRRHVAGRKGGTFDAFKFRTMVENADEILDENSKLKRKFKHNYKLKDDQRITLFGKILRKFSLDELPQLLNVLSGQMSLVGPRMVTPEELKRYGKFKTERLKVRPGISGYWQISGRQEVDYKERILMDRFYIYRWNIWMDLWIILKTVQKVMKMEGAY